MTFIFHTFTQAMVGKYNQCARHHTEQNDIGKKQATHENYGAELWRTDGTATGTVLVKDIYPGEVSGAPASLTPFGDYLYFQVAQDSYGVNGFVAASFT